MARLAWLTPCAAATLGVAIVTGEVLGGLVVCGELFMTFGPLG